MAQNLLKAGQAVSAFDFSQSALDAVAASGGVAVGSVKELKECETVITMLPSSPHVASTVDKLLDAGWEGKLLIDSSTIDPLTSEGIAKKLRGKGIGKIDAPVSGGVKGAEAGTLTFMVGGEEKDLEAARSFLEIMGGNIVHCGSNGAGQSTKLCNNLAMGIQMIGVVEALNMGTKLGLDAKTLASVMNTSTSRCWSSDSYNPYPGVCENVPASRDYENGFGVSLMLKDLKLATHAAEEVRSPTPLGNLTKEIYTMCEAHGYGEKDFGVVIDFLNKKGE